MNKKWFIIFLLKNFRAVDFEIVMDKVKGEREEKETIEATAKKVTASL